MMLRDYAAQLRAMGAGYVPRSFGRHVPIKFAFLLKDVNYSTANGAVWAGAVRSLPDASGSPLVTLTITAVVQGADTLVTVTGPAPSTFAPAARSTGEAAPLFYDIHMTPSGATKQVLLGGDFNIIAGVVQ
jgi:hypothetical protein